MFAHDLNNSTLVTCPASDIDSLFEQYNTGIVSLMNKHAPIIRRTIHVRARQLWRTDDMQQLIVMACHCMYLFQLLKYVKDTSGILTFF